MDSDGERPDLARAPLTVVIVDDSMTLRKTLATILEASGFDVVGTASSGEQAVGLVGVLKPDLVTLDIGLPGMDGIETLGQIRLISPQTHVVMVTASDDPDMISRSVELGAENYITKPYDPDTVIKVLDYINFQKDRLE